MNAPKNRNSELRNTHMPSFRLSIPVDSCDHVVVVGGMVVGSACSSSISKVSAISWLPPDELAALSVTVLVVVLGLFERLDAPPDERADR